MKQATSRQEVNIGLLRKKRERESKRESRGWNLQEIEWWNIRFEEVFFEMAWERGLLLGHHLRRKVSWVPPLLL